MEGEGEGYDISVQMEGDTAYNVEETGKIYGYTYGALTAVILPTEF